MNKFYNFDVDQTTDPTQVYRFDQGFTEEELNWIDENVQSLPLVGGGIASTNDTDSIKSIRKSSVRWVPQNEQFEWIYDRIKDLVVEANNELWKFDLHSMPESIQFTEYYEDGGHYDWHMDIGPNELSQRKISVTVQLSDPNDYEGGDLELLRGGSNPEKCIRSKGAVVIFPSYIMHRVTPVTKGTRKSFVLWLGGKHFI